MRELSDAEWEKLREKMADYILARIDIGKLNWDLKRLNRENSH